MRCSRGAPPPVPPRPAAAAGAAAASPYRLAVPQVGRDLTRVCLPVYFNEPLSALQKTAEDLEYSELLDRAAALPPASPARLLRVAAFAVSAYSSTGEHAAGPGGSGWGDGRVPWLGGAGAP